jgi:hypothetical protein
MSKELKFELNTLTVAEGGIPTERTYGGFAIDGKKTMIPIFSVAAATHFLNSLKAKVPAFADIDVAVFEEQVRAACVPDTIDGVEFLIATGNSTTDLPDGITVNTAENKMIDVYFDRAMQDLGLIPRNVRFEVCNCGGNELHGYLHSDNMRLPISVRSIAEGKRLFELVKANENVAHNIAGAEFEGVVETSLRSFGLPEVLETEENDRASIESDFAAYDQRSSTPQIKAMTMGPGGLQEIDLDALLGGDLDLTTAILGDLPGRPNPRSRRREVRN